VAGEFAAAAAALVNEAYEVLSSDASRLAFDADREDWLRWGQNGKGAADLSLMDATPLSNWSGPVVSQSDGGGGAGGDPLDAVFVDESHCIGCLKCALLAPKTFFIETRFGCARVVDQWADGVDAVEDAIAACPVQCIHFVDRTRELPLLERVAARQWHEGGSGGGSGGRGRGGGSASPFAVAASLRRRADANGIAPWPSRRGRGADAASTTAAEAAVAAAVAAAAAAAAATSEASAWAEATRGSGGSSSSGGTEQPPLVFAIVPAVPVSEYIFAELPPGPFAGNAAATDRREGTSSRGTTSRLPAETSGSSSRARSAREVARVQSLLEGGSGSGSFDDDNQASAEAEEETGRRQPEFWEPLPLSERPGSGSGSFDEETTGGYAPSEWVQATRRRAAAAAQGGGRGRSALQQRASVFASVPPLATVAAAALLAAAAQGGVLFAAAAGDEGAGMLAAEAASSEMGMLSASSYSSQVVVVNGVAVEWLTGPWAQLGCGTAAWTLVLSAAMLVLDAVVFTVTQGRLVPGDSAGRGIIGGVGAGGGEGNGSGGSGDADRDGDGDEAEKA